MQISKKILPLSLALVLAGSSVLGQSLADAKKAIDAEQYHKGKSILKALTESQPGDAANFFYLGNLYLKTEYIDSAKMAFTNGIKANANYPLNYVGLGSISLTTNNTAGAKTQFDKAISLTGKKEASTYLFIGKAYITGSKPDGQAALAALNKAKSINPKDAEIYLALGDAFRIPQNNSEAYSNYRTAFDLDNNLLRAKLELGVITKLSKAFPEAVTEFNKILTTDPEYGPAYRELAESYYWWGNAESGKYTERVKQALLFYEKYMDLTDRSLESRERHADFLIVAKEWQELEKEAKAIAQMDKSNPRILRYLGYSAYENQNYPESVQALNDLIAKIEPTRIISQDYLYLGRALIKIEGSEAEGIKSLRKAIGMDPSKIEVMNDIGKSLYSARKFQDASESFQMLVDNPFSKNKRYDMFYLGVSHYFNYTAKLSAKEDADKAILTKADSAFSYVISMAPDKPESYLYRARVRKFVDNQDMMKGLMVPDYEKYVQVVMAKTDPTSEFRAKGSVIEAYNNLGAFYQRSDVAKAKDYFKKVLLLDPSDNYARSALKSLL
jgi:tetratricopeptide (TPR) repeat protein